MGTKVTVNSASAATGNRQWGFNLNVFLDMLPLVKIIIQPALLEHYYSII